MPYTPPSYPSTIPSTTDLPDRTDHVDTNYSADLNNIKKELLAALAELGTLPKGSFGTVKARLEDIEQDVAALSPVVCKSIITLPYNPGWVYNPGINVDDNTVAHVCKIIVPFKITAAKITVECTDPGFSNLPIKIGLYSEDGQTKHWEVTTAAITAMGLVSVALSPAKVIPAGVYYIVILSVGEGVGAALSIYMNGGETLSQALAGEDVCQGVIFDLTADTLPATFDPTSDIFGTDGEGAIVRFDD